MCKLVYFIKRTGDIKQYQRRYKLINEKMTQQQKEENLSSFVIEYMNENIKNLKTIVDKFSDGSPYISDRSYSEEEIIYRYYIAQLLNKKAIKEYQSGKLQKARDDYQSAVSYLYPLYNKYDVSVDYSYRRMLSDLAFTELRLEDKTAAVKHAKQAYEIEIPGSPSGLDVVANYAHSLLVSGEKEGAKQIYLNKGYIEYLVGEDNFSDNEDNLPKKTWKNQVVSDLRELQQKYPKEIDSMLNDLKQQWNF